MKTSACDSNVGQTEKSHEKNKRHHKNLNKTLQSVCLKYNTMNNLCVDETGRRWTAKSLLIFLHQLHEGFAF